MKLTNSKMKSFNRCKRSYYYKFEKNIVPKMPEQPLKRGTWLHELLEYHHNGGDWRIRHAELTADFNRLFPEERDYYGDLPALCGRIMSSYVFHYKDEDKNLKVIATEEELEVPLSKNHTLKFKFDMIAEDEFGRWLWENKSHTTIPDADYRFIDTQTNLYVFGLNELGIYGEIVGICWNYLRAKPPTIPQLKKDGDLSKRKIDTDAYTFVKALRDYGLDPKDYRDDILRLRQSNSFFRRERVPMTPKVMKTLIQEATYTADQIERGYEPVRSIDRSCSWCSYVDLCVVDLYGGDSKRLEGMKYRPRQEGEYYGADDAATV